jgi:hypothetical protein
MGHMKTAYSELKDRKQYLKLRRSKFLKNLLTSCSKSIGLHIAPLAAFHSTLVAAFILGELNFLFTLSMLIKYKNNADECCKYNICIFQVVSA